MKGFILISLLLSVALHTTGQELQKPKIGLTLSGGGAKGLAHIGILEAIDSAGLEIDAITGTSMGAIVGSLYAVGYSGKEIEKLARSMNWNELFRSVARFDQVGFLEKDEFGKYPLHVPLEKGKIKPYTGIFEAQDIWKEFGKLYFPVYDIKDFSEFDIPFLCIATDLATGKPVIMREGDITTAVRASMAIPSLFTTVDYNNTKLVDGGVVINFPVDNLKEFGVDYFIGVNLSVGMQNSEKLNNPVDVLLQIAFIKDDFNSNNQKLLCDIYIEPDLEGFSAASFNSSDSIIDVGIETGNRYYPYFKKLADSLNGGSNISTPIGSRLPVVKEVVIDSIEVKGLNREERDIFKMQLGINTGGSYNSDEITYAVDMAYSTLAYKRISYNLDPIQPSHAKIIFDVEKNPKTSLNFGVHYNTYSGSAIIAGINSQNEFIRNSRTILKVNISENFSARIKHQQFFAGNKRRGLEISGHYEFFKFPVYQDFEQEFLYKSNWGKIDMNLFQLIGRSGNVGLGVSKEWLSLKPEINPDLILSASNNFWNAYFFTARNTLDDQIYSQRGGRFDLKAGLIFNQNPDASFEELGNEIQVGDSMRTATGDHFKLTLKVERYFPVKKRGAIFYQFNSGINFDPKLAFLNYYSVGGLRDFLRDQIVFAGLKENMLNTNSIASFQLGIQVELLDKFFTILRANTALYDFIELSPKEWDKSNLMTGYSLTAGYNSIIGPIEFSFLYNNQNKTLSGHLAVGFAF